MSRRPGFLVYGLLIAFVLGSTAPLYWSFLIGSHTQEVMSQQVPPLLPGGHFFENARRVFDTVPFWKALTNSVVVSGVTATSVVFFAVGVILAVQGASTLGPAMTTSPIPRDDSPLATNGVYAIVRNPIYTGLMSGGIGLALIGSSFLHVLTWLALWGVLAAKARWEERMLVDEHPAYSEYAARVGRFLPGIGRIR